MTIVECGKDFRSCGARTGMAVANVTKGTNGHVVAATEDAVVTTILFEPGDAYAVYKTAAYGSVISLHHEDRLAGRKVTDHAELEDGRLPEDVDVDAHDAGAWGPGEPWRTTL